MSCQVSTFSSILLLATGLLLLYSETTTVDARDSPPFRNTKWCHTLDPTRPWRSTLAQFPLQAVEFSAIHKSKLRAATPSDCDIGIAFPVLSGGIQLNRPCLSYAAVLLRSVLDLRGGQDDEDTEDDDDEEEDDTSSEAMDFVAMVEKVLDVTKTKIMPVVIRVSRKSVQALTRVSISTYHAMKRAIQAGLEGEDYDEGQSAEDADDDTEVTMLDRALKIAAKAMKIVKRMVHAALDFPEAEGGEEDEEEANLVAQTKIKAKKLQDEKTDEVVDNDDGDDVDEGDSMAETTSSHDVEGLAETDTVSSSSTTAPTDLGAFLATEYNVEDKRDKKDGIEIMGGSLQEGLRRAQSQARMLIVFIPAQKLDGSGNRFPFFGRSGNTKVDIRLDQAAVGSLLSAETAKAVNKKSRKNGPAELGSFAIWAAKVGSSESAAALKRLQVKATSAKGEKRPVLCVVYPAYVSVSLLRSQRRGLYFL